MQSGGFEGAGEGGRFRFAGRRDVDIDVDVEGIWTGVWGGMGLRSVGVAVGVTVTMSVAMCMLYARELPQNALGCWTQLEFPLGQQYESPQIHPEFVGLH